ncbi:condensation domain-containing protein [Streptomyces sp. NPDC046215]|uniref:Carrier domain-containing protein n=1 Tax=Streptomyces stramineus TaxID=173861 RepID=A0ABN0ZMN7_9ACTN
MTTPSNPPHASHEAELLRRARQRTTRPRPPGRPAATTGPAPLSHAQHRMWLMDRLGQGGARYNVPFATRLRGPLDLDALTRALTGLVRRHTVLRTRYGHRGDEPFQEVTAPVPVPVRLVDLTGPAAAPAEDPGRLLREEAARPFDLAAGPVLRALCVRHAPEDHTLLLTLHHIAVDGGSLPVLARDVADLYRAALEGREADGTDPAARVPQYADFARRERADSAALDTGLAYWTGRLTGVRPVPLPAPPGGGAHGAGHVLSAPLAPRTLAGLRAVGRAHRATLFTVVLAGAFATLLEATGAEDFAIGCASSHRDRAGTRDLVGLCVNTLAIRPDLSGAQDFATLLTRVRGALLEAQEYRHTPYDLVVERLGGAVRDRYGTALTGVTADVLTPPVALGLHGTRGEPVDIDLETAKFPLGFYVEEATETTGPRCLVQYDRGRLDEGTARELLRSFADLLAAVATDPGRPLARPARHPAETLLRERPEVAEALLLEREGLPPAAYVVPSGTGTLVREQLVFLLRERLDASEVPATVTVLDTLPRSADGTPDPARLPGSPKTPARPLGERGREVTAAFADMLGETPAPDTDFFFLGGHSLLAVRLAERLRERLRVPVTGLDVMEHRTPRALAAVLDARAAEQRATPSPRARRACAAEGTVLVTGGTGGVGAFVIRELTALGRPVRALARPESAHLVSADGVEVAEGDLGDPDSLRAAVSGGVSAVVHAACTFTDPATDVAAMRALLDGWTRGPFVFVSSVDAYGRPPGPEVGEGEAAVRPVSAYGQGKLDCERLLLAAAGTRGRGGASAVRAPLVWGPHPRFRDQLRWGATGELFRTVRAGEPVDLPGDGWYGTPWIHAAALARVLVSRLDHPAHGVVNAVGGHVGWAEFAAELIRLLGSRSELRTPAEARDPELLRRLRYRADALADELAPRPGEEWRTVLAEMLRE